MTIRKKIDVLDLELKTLFLKRMELIKEVKEIKKSLGLNTYDRKREEEMIENLTKDLNDNIKNYYLEFLKNYIEISKKYQDE